MVKCRIRLLVTLILTLVATATFSTLSSARTHSSPDGSVSAAQAGGVKVKPVALTGEPDQPQSPPPLHLNGGVTISGDGTPGGDVSAMVWWVSWIWATLSWRTAH
ncbi:MAG TPA: hypothetical protein VGK89_03320 [Candidatus Eisenbacteria bacterium]|jgi:hypothetical protein